MKLELVDFETAKLLKEKGFDWVDKDQLYYTTTGDGPFVWYDHEMYNVKFKNDGAFSAVPTLALAQKWLRDVHSIIIFITDTDGPVLLYEHNLKTTGEKTFKTYEQAQLAAINEALKLI